MKYPPYIGVTGFRSREEVERVLIGYRGTHELMVGVLADSNTLRYELPHRPERYPAIGALARILSTPGNAQKFVHYRSLEPSSLGTQLNELLRYATPACGGLQLNLPWPDLGLILTRVTRERRVVLKLGPEALALADHNEHQVVEKLSKYKGHIHDVLLKVRKGAMGPTDLREIARYQEAIEASDLRMRVGIAGGLSANNVGLILPLLSEGDLSLDAYSALRTHQDELDTDEAIEFANRASAILTQGAALRALHSPDAS